MLGDSQPRPHPKTCITVVAGCLPSSISFPPRPTGVSYNKLHVQVHESLYQVGFRGTLSKVVIMVLMGLIKSRDHSWLPGCCTSLGSLLCSEEVRMRREDSLWRELRPREGERAGSKFLRCWKELGELKVHFVPGTVFKALPRCHFILTAALGLI